MKLLEKFVLRFLGMVGFVYGYATARVRWLFSASARGEKKHVETGKSSRRGTGAVEYICVMGLILVMSVGLVSSFGGTVRRIVGGTAGSVSNASYQVDINTTKDPTKRRQKAQLYAQAEAAQKRAQTIRRAVASGTWNTLGYPNEGAAVQDAENEEARAKDLERQAQAIID